MHDTPPHAIQVIWPRVWILPNKNPITAAMATKMAVQMEWVDKALRLIEMLSIPEPATKTQSRHISTVLALRGRGGRCNSYRGRR